MPVFHEPSSQGLRNFPRPAQPCNLEPSTRPPALCPQQRHRLERRKGWRSLWPRRCRRPESSLRSCPSILSLVSLLSGSLLRSQPLTGYVRRRTLVVSVRSRSRDSGKGRFDYCERLLKQNEHPGMCVDLTIVWNSEVHRGCVKSGLEVFVHK